MITLLGAIGVLGNILSINSTIHTLGSIHMSWVFDLISFAVGVLVGSVITVTMPIVFAWTKRQVASLEADVKALEAVVADKKAAANTTANTTSTKV